MEQPIKKPGVLVSALIGVCGVTGMLYPLGLLIAPGLFGYAMIAGGFASFGISMLVAMIGAALASYFIGFSGFVTLALLLASGLLIRYMLKRRNSYFEIALAEAALFAAVFYLTTSLPDLLNGNTAFFTLQHRFPQYWDGLFEGMEGTLASLPLPGGAETADLAQMGKDFAALLPTIMPAVIITLSAVLGLSNVIFCLKFSQRAHAPIPPIRQFALWQLPKSFSYGVALIVAGVFAVSILRPGGLYAIVAAAAMFAIIPFAVQGLSLFWFALRLRGGGLTTGLFISMLALVALFSMPTCLLSMAFVGVFEQMFCVRKKIIQRGRPGNL